MVNSIQLKFFMDLIVIGIPFACELERLWIVDWVEPGSCAQDSATVSWMMGAHRVLNLDHKNRL
jgi:hypothetical protein